MIPADDCLVVRRSKLVDSLYPPLRGVVKIVLFQACDSLKFCKCRGREDGAKDRFQFCHSRTEHLKQAFPIYSLWVDDKFLLRPGGRNRLGTSLIAPQRKVGFHGPKQHADSLAQSGHQISSLPLDMILCAKEGLAD